jgi:regulator of RNase E activity RraA
MTNPAEPTPWQSYEDALAASGVTMNIDRIPAPRHDALTADAALLARLRSLPAANIGDAQDRLNVMDADIHPIWSGARIIGPAFTVLTRPGDNLAIHAALTHATPGDVLVVAGGGHRERALIGELIGGRARTLGIAGFVIDGSVRDAEGLAAYGIPVFARSISAAGPFKDGPGALGVPVAVGGVAVLPGDLIVGDADGVVVITRDHSEQVVAKAEGIRDSETAKRQKIEAELRDIHA